MRDTQRAVSPLKPAQDALLLDNSSLTIDQSADRFEYIVVDEFHHAAAPSYQALLDHVQPTILLGLTATPERSDQLDVLSWFGGRASAEIRLPDATVLLPGFVDFSRLTAWDIALVALTLVVVIGGINAGYAVLGARARHFFADARAQRNLHRVAGTLMLLAALLVATR